MVVKRRHLEQMIAGKAAEMALDWSFLRAGGAHDLFTLDGLRIIIPRHTEIAKGTAEKLLKDTELKLGERWWRR
jgi:hypothetical protein